MTLCSPDDVGGDGLPITTDGTPTDTPNTGPTSEPIATVTPPLTGLCNGPDGNRVSQSNQAKIAFKAASGTELGTTKYDLNEVLHKSILFYEVLIIKCKLGKQGYRGRSTITGSFFQKQFGDF